MPTPPMLRTRPDDARRPGPDPLVTFDVVAGTVVAIGLLLAGFLAVYTYSTPGAEAPLVLWLALVASATVVVNVAVMTMRHVRRVRLGL